MYDLEVFYPGDRIARHTERVQAASDVLSVVPKLLGVHAGCERIEVMNDEVRLFAVDRAGNTLSRSETEAIRRERHPAAERRSWR